MRILSIMLGLLTVLLVGACSPGDESSGEMGARAAALLRGIDGVEMGEATLTQGPGGVLISVEVRGLSPGAHGFHIHSVGACEPDFSAAGGHFNPGGEGHGLLHEDGAHAGDLPNIYASDVGVARADSFTAKVTLEQDEDHSLFDADGSAFIVHAKADSYGAEPEAGERVACGVIERR